MLVCVQCLSVFTNVWYRAAPAAVSHLVTCYKVLLLCNDPWRGGDQGNASFFWMLCTYICRGLSGCLSAIAWENALITQTEIKQKQRIFSWCHRVLLAQCSADSTIVTWIESCPKRSQCIIGMMLFAQHLEKKTKTKKKSVTHKSKTNQALRFTGAMLCKSYVTAGHWSDALQVWMTGGKGKRQSSENLPVLTAT